jgi:hypothetical protein
MAAVQTGFSLGFWSLIVLLINHKFALLPMHDVVIWTPLACIFYLVYSTKEDQAFGQVIRFLFLYAVVCTTLSLSFGLQYVFGLKRIFFGER